MRLAVTLFALMFAASGAAAANDAIEAKAQEVIDRTRTTTVTHAVYYRTHDLRGAEPKYWWSAVFHQGSSYRTESPWNRIVADCTSGTGTRLAANARAPGGAVYTTDARYAKEACGISADREILSAKWIGQKQGLIGTVDQIEISELKGTYLYSVGQRGEILAIVMTHRGATNPIVTEAVAIKYQLPDRDIFSIESLQRSIVTNKMKRKAAPLGKH